MISKTMDFARQIFATDASGHDFGHTIRVFHMATRLAEEEGADIFTVQLAALLHDVDDKKLSPQTCEGKLRARAFLEENGADAVLIQTVTDIITRISFSTHLAPPDTIEGKCVQDADRLDAMGAIGIGRAFAFGGSRGRRMHDPEGQDSHSTVAHFYEKLLLLKDSMHTATGRRLAEERDWFMRQFLTQFYAEWEGQR